MKIVIISSINEIGEFLIELAKVDTLYLDIETSSLCPFTCKLYSIQIKILDTYYIFDFTKFNKLDYLISLIENKTIVGHNIKFDCKIILAKTGINLLKVFDTMIAETLINLGIGKAFYSLKHVVEKYTNETIDKDIRESFYENGELSSLTQEQIIYSAIDVKNLETIMLAQKELLIDQQRVLELEMRLLPVVVSMEIEGITLDSEAWTKQMISVSDEVDELRSFITKEFISRVSFSDCNSLYDACIKLRIPVKTKRERLELEKITNADYYEFPLTERFNIGSYVQLKEALNFLGFNVESTSVKILEKLPKDEVIVSLLRFKELAKLQSSFGDSFLEKIHPVTGKVHAEANQVGTRSGRFSYMNPNLQQIPKVPEYRGCILPGEGFLFCRADWSQEELRIAGSISGEPKFIDAYKNKIDLHTLTASLIFDIAISDVTSEQRNIGKTLNFALLYGSTPYGLRHNLSLPLDVVEKLYARFFEVYPVLAYFKNRVEELAVQNRFVRTLYGRKRLFDPKTLYADEMDYLKTIGAIKREGFNTVIQGTGADILKLSMCDVYYNNPYGDPSRPLYNKLKLVLVIHDELVLKITPDIQEGSKKFMEEAMLRNEQMFLKDISAEIDIKIMDKLSK